MMSQSVTAQGVLCKTDGKTAARIDKKCKSIDPVDLGAYLLTYSTEKLGTGRPARLITIGRDS